MNPGNSLGSGTITRDSQQPALMQDNPAYITTVDNQREITLSSNPAYSTVYRDSQQPVLQDKPICLAANRSVMSLAMIGKRLMNNLLFVLIFRNSNASESTDDEHYYYSQVGVF